MCYNEYMKRKGNTPMKKLYFYEIMNTATCEQAQGIAHTFGELCKRMGWKPQDCKVIWKGSPDAAY